MSEAQSFEMSVDKLVSAGHSLWLAGLGAVAGMEETGRDLFDRLVERGRPLEKEQGKTLKTTLEKVGERTQETVRELGKLVQDTMEYETKGVLKRLGMLTRDDVKALASRLESLSRKIDEIALRQGIAPDAPGEGLPALQIEIHPKPRRAQTKPATVASLKAHRPRQRKN